MTFNPDHPERDDFSDLDPTIDPTVRINVALQVGSGTRSRVEQAAVHILTGAGIGDLAGRAVVRSHVYQDPATKAWLIDWWKLAEHRFEMHLSTGERAYVELACALAADTPLRNLGSSVYRMDARTREHVLSALGIAFGKE